MCHMSVLCNSIVLTLLSIAVGMPTGALRGVLQDHHTMISFALLLCRQSFG